MEDKSQLPFAEPAEQEGTNGFDLDRLATLVRRRHLHFLIPFFLTWLIVWGTSWFLPPRYRSGTLILVEGQTMPKDYVTPNIADDLQERLQSITQQILSRTRLLHIIDEFHLYSGRKAPGDRDAKVDRMRKDIDVELVRDGADRVTAFNIYYSSGDPSTAQQVTSELTNLFINENLEVRQRQSEGTTKFLADQLAAARENLTAQEQKVREFKSQHMGELPGQLSTNLQILSGLQNQLQNEADSLATAKQQHTYLQTLLDQYRASHPVPKNSTGAASSGPTVDDKLAGLKGQLTDLESRYTDRHPDIRKLREQIAKTEQSREQPLDPASNAAQNQHDAIKDDSEVVAATGEPSPMTHVKSELRANEFEISTREHAITELKAKIDTYQARLNDEPMREQELIDLTRGYDQSKSDYDDLLKKKNESAMATSMELMQQGERFRVIDPPNLPLKPDFPNRLKFCGIGLALGFGLGAVVVGALEAIDDRLYLEKEITDLLPAPVISEIPIMINPRDERAANRKLWLGWISAGVIATTILAGSALSYFRG